MKIKFLIVLPVVQESVLCFSLFHNVAILHASCEFQKRFPIEYIRVFVIILKSKTLDNFRHPYTRYLYYPFSFSSHDQLQSSLIKIERYLFTSRWNFFIFKFSFRHTQKDAEEISLFPFSSTKNFSGRIIFVDHCSSPNFFIDRGNGIA